MLDLIFAWITYMNMAFTVDTVHFVMFLDDVFVKSSSILHRNGLDAATECL